MPYVMSHSADDVSSVDEAESRNLSCEVDDLDEGTHRSAEPVSKMTSKLCAGVPMLMPPK